MSLTALTVSAAMGAPGRTRQRGRNRCSSPPWKAATFPRRSARAWRQARSTSAALKVEKLAPPKVCSTCAFVSPFSAAKMPTRLSSLGPPRRPAILARQRLGIGLRLADFLRDRIGVVVKIDARIIGGVRLRHFLGAVAQAHHPRGWPLDQRLGQRKERIAITMLGDRGGEIEIELLRDVAGKFQMLLLVLANRHMRRPIEREYRPPSAPDNRRARPRRSRGPCRPSP